MKRLKRLLAATLSLAMAMSVGVSLTGCNDDDDPNQGDNQGDNQGSNPGGNQGGNQGGNTGGEEQPPVVVPVDPTVQFTVTFVSNGGSAISSQTVNKGSQVANPGAPEYAGKQFVGWFSDEGCTVKFNFGNSIVDNTTLYAKWATLDEAVVSVGGYNEGLQVTWKDGAPSQAKAYVKQESATEWTEVDNHLIHTVDSGVVRVDAVGLKAATYNVKIVTSSGKEIALEAPVTVTSYDRSGYAHFKFTSGIGAYNDDGTLKDDAIVIYVTNANKDTVMQEVAEKYSDVNLFKIPGYGDKQATGIGWWMNNAQYSMDNANSSKNKKPSNTYDAANGKNLGFKSINANHSICVRIIGTVETPEGLTAYDSENEGGSVGDNGNMARMKNIKNITIEGIGEDAQIKGWGIHFMAGSDATNGQGKGFEVRNITFNEYTEDAIGMEGVQSGSKITGSVERCWIHNNTFLPGKCTNPAESDKAEGDGSCDFKRGMYFTMSYNYFEYCHKTNLLGSSDSSLQFNVTMHHNWWYQCGSRIPLTRQANVHFYNNYVYGDPMEKTTPYSHISAPKLSYVHSLRAHCYIFSEGNFYDGCKNVTDGKSGGAAKGWNNIVYANSGTNTIVEATSREQAITNSCAYDGTSFEKFDTDPNLFYYDAQNKKTDALVDDPAQARIKVMLGSGVLGWGNGRNTAINEKTPASAVNVADEGETTIALPTSKGESTVNGVIFLTTGASSGTIKGKGQIITFTLAAEAQITVTATSTGENAPNLISAGGVLYAKNFEGTLKTVLPAGTYVISTGLKDKESTISALSFANTGASSEARIQAAKDAINALPATVTAADAATLKAAQQAYNALSAKDKAAFDSALVEKLNAATATFNGLIVADAVAKINAIGTVTKDSFAAISAAQKAYASVPAELQAQVSNYNVLVAAQNAFAQFAVQNVIDMINALDDVTSWTTAKTETEIANALEQYETVMDAFLELDDGKDEGETDQQAMVTNVAKLNNGYAKLTQLTAQKQAHATFVAELNAVTDASTLSLQDCKDVTNAYNAMSDTDKAAYANNATYLAVVNRQTKLESEKVTCTFIDGNPSSDRFTTGSTHSKKGSALTVAAYGGELKSGMKFESATVMYVTVTVKMTLTMYMFNDKALNVDGTSYSPKAVGADNYVITVTLEPGKHEVKRDKSENSIFYATLTVAG